MSGRNRAQQKRPARHLPQKDQAPSHITLNAQQNNQNNIEINASGLPKWQELAGYESVVPGAGDRILLMSEHQGEHRRGLETKVIGGDNIRAYLGMMIGGALQAGVIWGAVHLGDGGHDRSAIALATGSSVTGLSTIWSN